MAETTEAKKPGMFRSVIESPMLTRGVKKMFGWDAVKVGYVQSMPIYKEVTVAPPSYDSSPGSAVPFDGASSMFWHPSSAIDLGLC